MSASALIANMSSLARNASRDALTGITTTAVASASYRIHAKRVKSADPNAQCVHTGQGTFGCDCVSGFFKQGDKCIQCTKGCAGDEYIAETCSDSDLVCKKLTKCNNCCKNCFVGKPCGDSCISRDRQCQVGVGCACNALNFEIKAPTKYTDRVCDVLLQCKDDQYESVSPTFKSDRKCTDVKLCSENEYESEAATAFTDRVCATVKLAKWVKNMNLVPQRRRRIVFALG